VSRTRCSGQDDTALTRQSKREAKLVKLADKICNLRDILASPPANWSTERKRAYFDWAAQVVSGVRGVHPGLEAIFDGIYGRGAEFSEVAREKGV
jgi:GTP diphosphokinase / guanosine-3',5'-bis(diphosphate) 3'-diphosphatase